MAQRAYYDVLIPFGQIKRLKEILSQEKNLNVFINPLSHDIGSIDIDPNTLGEGVRNALGITEENSKHVRGWEKIQIRIEVNILGDQHRKNIETLIKVYDGEIYNVHSIGELPLGEKVKIFLKTYSPLATTVYASGTITALIAKWNEIFANADIYGVISIMALNLLTATSAVLVVMRFKNL